MRRYSAIFLFVCLVLPFLASYAWLEGRITAAKVSSTIKIKKAIPPEDQILWKFSLEDAKTKLFWEHSKEFEYKGEMYDIIRSQQHGDTIWYWCYWDRKETKLKRELNILIVNRMGPGPQKRNEGRQVLEFFRALYFQVEPSTSDPIAFYKRINEFSAYKFNLLKREIIPPNPPPEYS